MAELTIMSDTEMLDWLEAFVPKNGALVLHMGSADCGGNLGLGLEPGLLRRSLRQAIQSASGGRKGSGVS